MRAELKDILLYGLCVPSGLYALYEGSNLFSYISEIKTSSPECYHPNPNRVELFFGTMILLALLQAPVQAITRIHFESVLSESKFPKGSPERANKVQMMAERIYRFFLYLGFTLFGLWILKQGNFLHRYLLGNTTNPQYFVNYPCQQLPKYLDDFYVIKFSYHIYEIINAAGFHRNRRDFSEFLLHHIVTITMVGYSYCTNIIPIGGSIMLVMDASDVLVAVFKLTVDAYEKLQFPIFLSMVIGWVYFRIWFFPVYLITEIYIQAHATGHPA